MFVVNKARTRFFGFAVFFVCVICLTIALCAAFSRGSPSGVVSAAFAEGGETAVTEKTNFGFTRIDNHSYGKYDFKQLLGQIFAEDASISGEATVNWLYNGEDLDVSSLSYPEPGNYSVKVVLPETASYYASTFENEFTVTKAKYAGELTFASFSTIKVSYTGVQAVFDEPTPSNAVELTNAGYVWTYSYSAEDRTNCGTYVQTVTATSARYADLTKERNAVVQKVDLMIKVSDVSLGYNEEIPDSALKIETVSGAVGADEGKTFYEIVALEYGESELKKRFYTDYKKGDAPKDYDLSFTLKSTTNYNLVCESGVITVGLGKLDLSGVNFSDRELVYNGKEQKITASGIPSGATAVYRNNTFTDAGEYIAEVTLSKIYYEDEVLTARVTVKKRTINISVSSKTVDYGYAFNTKDFTFSHGGLLETDDFGLVTENVTFSLVVAGASDGTVLDAGKYAVKCVIGGEEPQNYDFSASDGALIVKKVSLTNVYVNGKSENTDFDSRAVEYDGTDRAMKITYFEQKGLEANIVYKIVKKDGTSVTMAKDVGEYKITATVTPLGTLAKNYVETEYVSWVEVTLINTAIIAEDKEFFYAPTVSGSVDYATEAYVSYTAQGIPEGGKVELICKKNGITVPANVAGKYDVVLKYTGDGNYASCETRITLTVKPIGVRLVIDKDYVYKASAVTPDIISKTFVAGEEILEGEYYVLSDENVAFSYKMVVYAGDSRKEQNVNSMISAGTYVVNAKSKDVNYEILAFNEEIIIAKCKANISIGELTVPYGAKGTITRGEDEFYFDKSYIVFRNCYVDATDRKTEIRFTLGNGEKFAQPGEYADLSLFTNDNYDFTLTGVNKVVITKRKLTAVWSAEGMGEDSNGFTAPYAGKDLSDFVTFVLEGFAEGEDATAVKTELAIWKGAEKTPAYHVGTYLYRLTLQSAPYYELDSSTSAKQLTITRITLKATVSNAEIMQKEPFSSIPIFFNGLVGEDFGKDRYELSGYRCKLICAYNENSPVGSKFDVGAEIELTDYVVPAEYVTKGVLTVVAGYPDYVFGDKTFVYDGGVKRIEVPNVQEGTTVTYANNDKIKVGEYTVYATITYPSGRLSYLSAKLTITKATATVVCPEIKTVYKQGSKPGDPYADGAKTYLGNEDNPVPGRFYYESDYAIVPGVNEFWCVFVPDDDYNFARTRFKRKITSYAIDGSAFVFGGEYELDEEGRYELTNGSITISLNASGNDDFAERLTIAKNGVASKVLIINAEGEYTLSVLCDGKTVYSMKIIAVLPKKAEDQEIKVNYEMLDVVGVEFVGENVKISEGAVMKLKTEYKNEYALYVNGELINNEYVVPADVTKITLVIKNLRLGVGMYSETFEVERDGQNSDGNGGNDPNGEISQGGFKTYYYYIIGGVAGAIAIIVVVVVVIIKRR